MNKKKSTNKLHNIKIPQKKTKKQYCHFCKYRIHYIDYKEATFLARFLNPQGKILPPRYTGNCHRHQIRIAHIIKRSRTMAYLPYVADNLFQN